ncbi:hypothetical protein [Roseomonas chloroacetimidivorans]|jgi:hypothetical protein|uniref:hypothetical protein n=1 Tax=Roseomonas chloroacetimidivorans TaxID=1766656 RepID=UPI003C71862C
MDKNRTDQKRDETGEWVSDLNPGATSSAKQDKAVEDTFPASDPANMNTGATGFIAPDGEDLGKAADQGSGEAGAVSGGKP